MPPPDLPSPSCPYMAQLVTLLCDLPTERDGRRPDVVAEHLAQLESEGRANGAPETTLTAIQGARALLAMSELPPETQPDP